MRKIMVVLMLVGGVVLFVPVIGWANNLLIENISLADEDVGNDTYDLEFDVSWDNSWFITGAPSLTANWDSTWVFAKFSTFNGAVWSDWAHATLLNTGSVAPAGSQISFGITGAAYMGAFVYRSAAGTGSNNWDNAQLRWDYGADGVADGSVIKVQVFGIEMVYVPQGNFYVGDTDNDRTNCFHEGGATTELQITSEGAITVADTAGNLYYDADNAYGGDRAGPVPADFPKGYDAFYIMKYEISQGQYSDFLNSLTRTHQNNRSESQTANQYTMSNSANVDNRSGIRNPASIPGGAITFGCDLDGITADNTTAGDGTFNESDDGQGVAANFLSWMDGAAYADWSGLRPFTELEFTKATRGGQIAVDDEYAWGSTVLESDPISLSNSGHINEVANQGNMNYSSAFPDGPFRVGSFADGTSTRTNAGAGYFGALDLSGSMMELTVTLGNATGRAFTGTHGDGVLSTDGFATNSDWPGYDGDDVTGATGSGFRGGRWSGSSTYALLTDRYIAAYTATSRANSYGFRCARTSP